MLHDDVLAGVDRTLGLHGIATEPLDGGVLVPMGQRGMRVVPFLLDERASFNMVAGQVVDDCDDVPEPEPPPPPPEPSEPAQHFVDFSDDEVGDPPTGWTPQWRDSDWTVLDDPRRLRHEVDAAGGRRALTWDEPGLIVGDVEVYTQVRARSDGTMFQVPIHLSGDAGTENAFYADTRLVQQDFRIQAYTAGTPSTLARTPFEVVEDRWYHVVLRHHDGRLQAKIWADGDDEPDGWMLELDDERFDGCTINDLILDEEEWPDKDAFMEHVAEVLNDLQRDGVITGRERGAITSAAARSDVPPEPVPLATDFSVDEVGQAPAD